MLLAEKFQNPYLHELNYSMERIQHVVQMLAFIPLSLCLLLFSSAWSLNWTFHSQQSLVWLLEMTPSGEPIMVHKYIQYLTVLSHCIKRLVTVFSTFLTATVYYDG